MSPRKHRSLFFQAVTVWAGFWVAGLPNYYQQYSTVALAIGSIFLSVGISLIALFVLRRGGKATRIERGFWLSFYFSVPLFFLDAWYCGIHLGHGWGFLTKYWYLTVFYVTPWLTFLPTAYLIDYPARQDANH